MSLSPDEYDYGWPGDGTSSQSESYDPWWGDYDHEAPEDEPAHEVPSATMELDDDQRAAVEHFEGPALVVAGAGSGKTRVLVQRVVHLVDKRRVEPSEVLAVTFSRRAAGEMRGRLVKLGKRFERVKTTTYHSLALTICRDHPHLVGRNGRFSVWDDSMSTSQVRQAIKEVWKKGDSDKPPTAKEIKKFLGLWKRSSNPLRGELYDLSVGQVHTHAKRAISEYERVKASANSLDFDDLFWRATWALESSSEALEAYRERWTFLLVDEYQDTNAIQERFVTLIAGERRNLFVVGDEDQSIFGFQGASVAHILTFQQRHEGAKLYQLGQNYRSSGSIVVSAARIIAWNRARRDKVIFTRNDHGWPIEQKICRNQYDESEFIAASIQGSVDHGYALKEHAVLVRLRRQIPSIQLALHRWGLPHRTIGYVEIHQRPDIRLVLAWLRSIVNPRDLASGALCLGAWPGVGATTVACWKEQAVGSNEAMYRFVTPMLARRGMGVKTKRGQALLAFHRATTDLVEKMMGDTSILELVEWIYEITGMDAAIDVAKREGDAEANEQAVGREQLKADFLDVCPAKRAPNPMHEVSGFLDVLAVNAATGDQEEDKITITTIHSAKGREWDHVWIPGFCEGIIPHKLSAGGISPGLNMALEEERRAAYVAFTRAKLRLVLCRPRFFRDYDGRDVYSQPSRFLAELEKNASDALMEPMEPEELEDFGDESVCWESGMAPPWELEDEDDE